MPDWQNALYGAGMGIINNSLGIINGKISRKENYKYGEMAADNADARTRALYNDLYSIPAQMLQLKNAGLSPSLFYGQAGGISGQTGAMGTGASGVQNPTFGVDPFIGAQLNKVHAETANLNAQTEAIEGNTPTAKADIAQKLADAGLKDAEKAYKVSQTAGQELANYITNETKDFEIRKAYAISEKASSEANKAIYDAMTAYFNADYLERTQEERIRAITLENKLLDAQTLLTKANLNLNKAEIDKIAAEIEIWQEQVAQGWSEVYIKMFNANTEKERNGILNDYFDGQIENLNNRLDFDKSKFRRENAREWTELVTTLINDNNHYFCDKLMEIIPDLIGKKPKPIGFR